jgi:GNAT superfamily N-acetyltransferase
MNTDRCCTRWHRRKWAEVRIAFRKLTGQCAEVVLGDEYVDVYLAIRAEPPYNSAPLYTRDRFLERTRTQLKADGFELVAAEGDGKLIGFAFGFTMGHRRWWGGEATRPPEGVLQTAKLAVVELNLRQEHRGRGIGKRLLGELLQGRREPYATLLSRPEAPAHAMYERWGWQVVGTVRPAPDAAVSDAMVLSLRSTTLA